ncbi:Phosphatidic acid phosphatase type 2/haloperoxidase [Candidatus Magnetoovum chiemensis]|nr:Phosphatidic acid phosphatase type 2/haloperoxidase [Candidatus Magnetoovum chiemensis]
MNKIFLSSAIFLEKVKEIDAKTALYLTAYQKNRSLKKMFSLLTHLGGGPLWIIVYLCLRIGFYNDTRHILYKFIVGEIFGLLVIILLRYLTKRQRPTIYAQKFPLRWYGYSFPSHHGFRAFFVSTVIYPYYRENIFSIIIVASLIGFSRIYLGRHFLSDVIVGALIGISIAIVLHLWLPIGVDM